MAKYSATILETNKYIVEIEAESLEDAQEKANEILNNSGYKDGKINDCWDSILNITEKSLDKQN